LFSYAFIEFTNLEAKENSIKNLNNSLFKGRQIKVEDKRQNIPEYFGQKSKKNNFIF
jgi:RNA recognition motif-containing protein